MILLCVAVVGVFVVYWCWLFMLLFLLVICFCALFNVGCWLVGTAVRCVLQFVCLSLRVVLACGVKIDVV